MDEASKYEQGQDKLYQSSISLKYHFLGFFHDKHRQTAHSKNLNYLIIRNARHVLFSTVFASVLAASAVKTNSRSCNSSVASERPCDFWKESVLFYVELTLKVGLAGLELVPNLMTTLYPVLGPEYHATVHRCDNTENPD